MAIDPRVEFSKTQILIVYTYTLVEQLIKESIASNLKHCRTYQHFAKDLRVEFKYLEGSIRERYSKQIRKDIIPTKATKRVFTEEKILRLHRTFGNIFRQTRDERILYIIDFLKERYMSMILLRGESEIQAFAMLRG